MRKLLFIHRSVGRDLIRQGKLRELLEAYDVALDDYDNNVGRITYCDGRVERPSFSMPGANTNPKNLARFFELWPEVLNEHDWIVIKSCFPNSHIKSEAQLEQIKNEYRSIIAAFENHDPDLLILTSPPLRPLFTNKREAKYASELADWLVSLDDRNVHVFDFYHALSEADGPQKGMLKKKYRRWFVFDRHPNARAHRELAPLFATRIQNL